MNRRIAYGLHGEMSLIGVDDEVAHFAARFSSRISLCHNRTIAALLITYADVDRAFAAFD
jgi:hypothetical protein